LTVDPPASWQAADTPGGSHINNEVIKNIKSREIALMFSDIENMWGGGGGRIKI